MFRLLIALCALTLSGCTTYEVKRADGSEVRIVSNRKFENLNVEYHSTEGATFKASAGKVDSVDTIRSLIEAVGPLLPLIAPLLQKPAVAPQAAPAVEPEQ